MSNVGQAALFVVGLVATIYTGNPVWLTLAATAGAALFPTQLPNGPRITDNRTTTATVGNPVPIVFGTADVAGTIIWLAPFVEHSQTEGGKGGPEQKTFSYTQSIAIGLCERVDDTAADDIGAISGISRIWENGTIVYDIRSQQEANTELGTPAESDIDYANRLTASAIYAETFVLYLGTETQTADPTIEAIEGAGNVPAFRALAYIVYPDRQLQLAQGQRHPNFTFELFATGAGECQTNTVYSNEVLYPWFNSGNVYTYKIQSMRGTIGSSPVGTTYTSFEDGVNAAKDYSGINQNHLVGYNVPTNSAGGAGPLVPLSGSVAIGSVTSGVTVDPSVLQVNYNFTTPLNGIQNVQGTPGSDPASLYRVPGAQWWATTNAGSLSGDQGIILTTHVSAALIGAFPPWDEGYIGGSRFIGWFWFETATDLVFHQARFPGPPPAPCDGLTPLINPEGYAIRADGRLIKCTNWVKDSSQTYKVLQKFAAGVGGGLIPNYKTTHPLSPCVPVSDTVNYDNATFWTDAYNAAVLRSEMPAGLVYNTDYPKTQSFGYVLEETVCEANGDMVRLSDIVSAICRRAGLTQIDVSDLVNIQIPGYSISGVCDAADIISPLRSIGFFDCVESGDVMKFPTRGKPVVATFDANDFGCFDGGATGGDGSANSGIPPAVTTSRSDETTMPRSIRLHYKAVSRDYQDGEADSPFRLATTAVDDQDISLPVILTDTQAVQSAEIIWSDAWAAQNSHELSIDQSWSHLEPGDCIGVPIDGVIQRLRIVSDSNAAGILRKLSCVRDSEGAYISFAVAEAPQTVPQTLKLIAPSSAEFLDLPCLQDADSDPGFYVAAQRQNGAGNLWKGATIYKSVDGGSTFTAVFSLITEATIGTLVSALPVSEAHTWDNDTVIDVTVASAAFTFESRTDDAVLAGANAAAVGDDGRWEIVQYANATKISDTHWQLSRLLRGRRGTEHNIGRSHINDRLVVISTGDVGRVVLQTTEIGAARVYKVVSIGASYASGIDTPFTGHAEALVPFSPTAAAAVQETGDGILISWVRRSRLGRTLMSGVDIPLGETTEAFQVDILDPASPDSPEVSLRTLSTTTESVLYTGAQQTADFGHTLPSGTILKVAIYQMSSVVGRGTPAIATITVG